MRSRPPFLQGPPHTRRAASRSLRTQVARFENWRRRTPLPIAPLVRLVRLLAR